MAYVSMCRVSQIIYLHFLRHPPPFNAWNSRKARALDSRLEWSSPLILNLLHVFSFWNSCFQPIWSPEKKNKISSFKTWNPLRVKKLAAHHIAWLGIYSFGQLGPKIPNPGPRKFNFWNPFARDWILTSLKGSSIMDPPAAVSEETNGNGTADQVDGLNLKNHPV